MFPGNLFCDEPLGLKRILVCDVYDYFILKFRFRNENAPDLHWKIVV
jgi:hypothetical protein